MTLKDQVFTLIQFYRSSVDGMIELLKSNASSFDGYKEVRDGMFKDGSDILFKFHGIGCQFCLPTGERIDVDFGRERYDLIDIYFLDDFRESLPHNNVDYSLIGSVEDVKRGIVELLQHGKLERYLDSLSTFSIKGAKPKVFEWD